MSIGIYLYNGEENLVGMCNEQSGKAENNSDTKGLEFAITLIAAFVSIAYAIYAYFQINPVDSLFYSLIIIVSPALLILPIGLITYVIIKGYLIECNPEDREKLAKPISEYYKCIFLMSIFVLLFVLIVFLVQFFALLTFLASFVILLYTADPLHIILTYIIILICIYVIISKYNLMKYAIEFATSSKKFIGNFTTQNWNIFLIGLFFWFILLPSATHILQGDITIDMESVYYRSDEQIPVLIRVTGPDAVLSVKLSNVTKDNNLNSIAFIERLKTHPSQKIEFDESLIGYSLSPGNYIVFVNTTNLSTGYYKLECNRTKNEVSDAKGFYLSDYSKIQINKAAATTPYYNV